MGERAVPRYPKDKVLCAACLLMEKDEQYARGWVRLHGDQDTDQAIAVAQYALELQKLRHSHEATHEEGI